MPTIRSSSRLGATLLGTTSLLTTTSVVALLLGAPAQAGQTITNQTVATVTNPAGQATTSIVITGSTVTGAVTNAGTITPGKQANVGDLTVTIALTVLGSTIGGGIANSGTINANSSGSSAFAINITGSTVSGGIANSGTIKATSGASQAIGLFLSGDIFGDIVGAGTSDTVTIDPTNNANNVFTYGNTISGVGATNIAANGNLALTAQGVVNNNIGVLAPRLRECGALDAARLPGWGAELQRLGHSDRPRRSRGRDRRELCGKLDAHRRPLLLEPARPTRLRQCLQGASEPELLTSWP
jgi:hypothetical protein